MSLGLSWVRFDFTALKVPAASIDHCPKLQAAHGEGLWKGQGRGQGRRQAHRGGARKKERERGRERAGARYRVLIDFFNQRKVPTMTRSGSTEHLTPTRPLFESATDPCSIFVYASHSHTHISHFFHSFTEFSIHLFHAFHLPHFSLNVLPITITIIRIGFVYLFLLHLLLLLLLPVPLSLVLCPL